MDDKTVNKEFEAMLELRLKTDITGFALEANYSRVTDDYMIINRLYTLHNLSVFLSMSLESDELNLRHSAKLDRSAATIRSVKDCAKLLDKSSTVGVLNAISALKLVDGLTYGNNGDVSGISPWALIKLIKAESAGVGSKRGKPAPKRIVIRVLKDSNLSVGKYIELIRIALANYEASDEADAKDGLFDPLIIDDWGGFMAYVKQQKKTRTKKAKDNSSM